GLREMAFDELPDRLAVVDDEDQRFSRGKGALHHVDPTHTVTPPKSDSTSRSSSRGLPGLETKAAAPCSSTRLRDSSSHRVLAAITGTAGRVADRFISASNAKPSSLGISRSVTTRP